jgi:hypothetical protein
MKHGLTHCLRIFIVVMLAFHAQAQMTVDFARGLGSTADDIGSGVAVDAAGNTFAVGRFKGNVDFNPAGTARILVSNNASFSDIYLVKYNTTGVVASATDLFRRGVTNDDWANKVYVDGSGNVYVIGRIFGTVTFGSGFTGTVLGNSGKAFIAK